MLFAPPRSDRILGRRLGGMAASAALHASVIAVASWPGPRAGPSVLQASGTLSAPAASPTVVAAASVPSRESLSSLPRRPALELAGIEVDLDKLRRAPAELFPFVLFESMELGVVRDTDRVERRLSNPLVSSR